jgi:hypothetical protein
MKKSIYSITIIAILLFLWFIAYEITKPIYEYIPESIMFIIFILIFLSLYNKLDLDILSYSSLIIAFLLHNAGAFGWYNISPVGFQWDHITHIVWGFAFTLIIFRYTRRFLNNQRTNNVITIFFIILASLGAGVIIELYEFAGYFIVGEGMGGLGHGQGDIVTEFGNSEWFNTMFDLIYNLVGTIIAMITGYILHYHKQ